MKWYLDFGHGGKDSGAVGTYNTKESDVVLKIGMIISFNLNQCIHKDDNLELIALHCYD